MARAFRLSVAIPVFDEETVVLELVRPVCDVLDRLAGGREIVFVDDGSIDHTFELLEPAAQKDQRIIVVSLSRNFAHQAALAAALDHVTDVSLPLDSGGFGRISRRAIDHLRRMPEHQRYLRGFADGIFAIRAAALLGAGVMLISMLYVCYSLYAKLFLHISPRGFTALIVAFAFLSGALFFFWQ